MTINMDQNANTVRTCLELLAYCSISNKNLTATVIFFSTDIINQLNSGPGF